MTIKLDEFDIIFFKSIKDNNLVFISDSGTYHTVIFDNKKVGIIGFVPSINNSGFLQIILDTNFRGKNLVKPVFDLLVNKYNLKTVYATIKIDNIASIKSLQKLGFNLISETELINLRNKKLIKKNELRYIKKI